MSRRLICTLVLAACTILPCASAQAQGKTLTLANYRDIRDLNPHLYSGELFAQNLLFEGLVQLDEKGNPQPWLAKSWEISADGLNYTFRLRDDVFFSDGTRFDAAAAKKNLDALLDNHSRHGWLESIRLMKEYEEGGKAAVEAPDAGTLVVHFTKPYYPFLIELGVTRPFRMLSPQCFKNGSTKDGIDCVVGTGSYILRKNVVDEYAEFVKNDRYWGEPGRVDTIVARVIPDNQARLLALQNEKIDLIFGLQLISPAAYQRFRDLTGFDIRLSEPVSTRMLILNTTRAALKEVEVRRALSLLVNKEQVAEKIMLGLESPAETLMPRNFPYCDIDLQPYTYNPQAAHALLEKAGWKKTGTWYEKNGTRLELTLSYDSDKVIEKTIGQYLQGEWGKNGIKLNLIGEEEQAHRDRLKHGNFEVSFNISWGTPYDPQSFLGGMRKPVYGDYAAQQGLAEKERLDDTILKALESVDEARRQELFTYVLTTLHEAAVYIPLTHERNRAIFRNRVKNVGFNPSQFEIPLQRMDVD